MQHPTLAQWHQFAKTQDAKTLSGILADDVVFHSPVVWTPQVGKPITMAYLTAATHVFYNGDDEFQYLREIVTERNIVLEFRVTLEGITINGIDMMELDEEGKIKEFKVLVRPLQAVNKLHEKMKAMLAQMGK